MKHRRLLALVPAIAVAAGAAGTSSATAALPEFVPAPSAGIESVIKATKFETVGKTVVNCKHGGNSGAITGPKTISLKIELFGCAIPGALCTSPGGEPGEIIAEGLTGTLGYIHKTTKVVGLDLSSGGTFTMFTCGVTPFIVEGSVIGRIAPVNKIVKSGEHFAVHFLQKEGNQKFPNFEGEPPDILSTSIGGKPFEPTGLAMTDEVFVVATLEIKA
jgi:hypothetical protein